MHALKYVRPFALVAAVSLVLAGCGADEPYDLTTDYVPAEVPASVEVNTDVQEMEVVNAESDEMENFNQGTFAEVEGLAEAAEKWQALGEQTDEELGRDDFGHVNVFAQADEAGGASYGQAVFINGGANDWAAAPGSYTFEVICFSPIGVGYTVRADAEDESGGWVVAGGWIRTPSPLPRRPGVPRELRYSGGRITQSNSGFHRRGENGCISGYQGEVFVAGLGQQHPVERVAVRQAGDGDGGPGMFGLDRQPSQTAGGDQFGQTGRHSQLADVLLDRDLPQAGGGHLNPWLSTQPPDRLRTQPG